MTTEMLLARIEELEKTNEKLNQIIESQKEKINFLIEKCSELEEVYDSLQCYVGDL